MDDRRYHIITFGCQMNEHDSETIAGLLNEKGLRSIDDALAADIVIINTCSVRENADKRFFGTLGQLKKQKAKNPEFIACVCGCMMQQEHIVSAIRRQYPWVDIVFGTHNIEEFPRLLEELDEMEAAVKANGVKFTVHHQRRFDPDFRTAKAVYDSGTLGDVYAIKSQLYGFNGNMHDWHVFVSEGGGMLYDWGVHLLDQVCWMFPGAKLKSVFADIRNVINKEVDDYFQIMMRFDNNVTATVELGTYYLADKVNDKWFERHWFVAGNKGTAYVDGFFPEGKIVRTTHLLTNVSGHRTMTAAGPTRSFGPAPEGTIVTEPLPEVHTEHRNYFENYVKAYHGEEEFLVKIPETRRILKLMNAVRESGRTGKSIDFE